MRVVIALGGNALLRRGEPLDVATQRANARRAAAAVAQVARTHDVVVTHGNGPQVGLLALQAAAYIDVEAYPLDVLGAESEGMVGYVLQQELANALPDREVATILTQVVVDRDDPSFEAPTKPIGPVYDEAAARRVAASRAWTVAPDGVAWRRVVPSPLPRRIVELGVIRRLVDAGVLVVCAGGGGVPVVAGGDGLRGVEAVVDKDRTAAVLARELDADALVMLTDVDAVRTAWGTPSARRVRLAGSGWFAQQPFAAGSMGPKVEAARAFVDSTGGIAAIGALDDAAAIVGGDAGTRVVAGAGGPDWW